MRTGAVALAGAVALVVGSPALAGTASAGTSAGTASAGGAVARVPGVGHPVPTDPRDGVCRVGEVHPVPALTARARVCIRFGDGVWEGTGELVLRATAPVTGAYSWGPRYFPVRPSGYVGSGSFTLRAGQTVTYRLGGTADADPADTGADWEVFVGVANGMNATGFEALVTSPVGSRTPSPDRASAFTGATRWTCTGRRVSAEGVSGVARLCVRQVRGTLESTALLTYTSSSASEGTVDVHVGLSVDGATPTHTMVPLAVGPGVRRTVTLPPSSAQARRQDRRAATYLSLGEVSVSSTSVPVR